MTSNECVLIRQRRNRVSYPAKIYAYLSLCSELKNNINRVQESSIKEVSKLPFFSTITEEFTPEGVIHGHWSFLRY